MRALVDTTVLGCIYIRGSFPFVSIAAVLVACNTTPGRSANSCRGSVWDRVGLKSNSPGRCCCADLFSRPLSNASIGSCVQHTPIIPTVRNIISDMRCMWHVQQPPLVSAIVCVPQPAPSHPPFDWICGTVLSQKQLKSIPLNRSSSSSKPSERVATGVGCPTVSGESIVIDTCRPNGTASTQTASSAACNWLAVTCTHFVRLVQLYSVVRGFCRADSLRNSQGNRQIERRTICRG